MTGTACRKVCPPFLTHGGHVNALTTSHWILARETPKSTTAATLEPAWAVAVPAAAGTTRTGELTEDDAPGAPSRFCSNEKSQFYCYISCVRACVCVGACVRACVRACVCMLFFFFSFPSVFVCLFCFLFDFFPERGKGSC